jgi:hypothetical protein
MLTIVGSVNLMGKTVQFSSRDEGQEPCTEPLLDRGLHSPGPQEKPAVQRSSTLISSPSEIKNSFFTSVHSLKVISNRPNIVGNTFFASQPPTRTSTPQLKAFGYLRFTLDIPQTRV